MVRRFKSSFQPGRLAGFFEMLEARMDLLEQIRLDHRPDRTLLAIVAGMGMSGGEDQCQRGDAEGEGERLHSTGLPTPSTDLAQIQPIAP